MSTGSFSIDDSFAQFQLGTLPSFQQSKSVAVVETEDILSCSGSNLLATLEESEHSSIFVFEDERDDDRKQKLMSALSSRSFVSSCTCDSRCSYRPPNDHCMDTNDNDDNDEEQSLKDLDITQHQELLEEELRGKHTARRLWKWDPLETTFVRNALGFCSVRRMIGPPASFPVLFCTSSK
jgi:hypothetical protein